MPKTYLLTLICIIPSFEHQWAGYKRRIFHFHLILSETATESTPPKRAAKPQPVNF